MGYLSLATLGSALDEKEDFGFASISVESQELFVEPAKSIVIEDNCCYRGKAQYF